MMLLKIEGVTQPELNSFLEKLIEIIAGTIIKTFL